MGGRSRTPKPTAQQKALEFEQQRQLSELSAEENRRAKALMRGRFGMRQLLGPMGVLGSEAPMTPTAPTAPAGPRDDTRTTNARSRGGRRGRIRRSLVGTSAPGGGPAGGSGVAR